MSRVCKFVFFAVIIFTWLQNSRSENGVQRLGGEFVINDNGFIPIITKTVIPSFRHYENGQIVLMLICPPSEIETGMQIFVLFKVHNTPKDVTSTRTFEFYAFGYEFGKKPRHHYVKVPIKDILAQIDNAYDLVESAKIGTQDENFLLGPNQEWYMFVSKLNQAGTIVSPLQMGHSINPNPEEGMMPGMRRMFLKLIDPDLSIFSEKPSHAK